MESRIYELCLDILIFRRWETPTEEGGETVLQFRSFGASFVCAPIEFHGSRRELMYCGVLLLIFKNFELLVHRGDLICEVFRVSGEVVAFASCFLALFSKF